MNTLAKITIAALIIVIIVLSLRKCENERPPEPYKEVQVFIDTITKEIEVKKEKLIIIKKEKHEKVRAIDTLTVSEYQQFFTERYTR
jgi:hypothetical protein